MQIRFLADPSAAFTKALDLGFDGTAIFGGVRGKRYALKVVDGKVAAAHVEPDGTGYKGEFVTSSGSITFASDVLSQFLWLRRYWTKRLNTGSGYILVGGRDCVT